MKETSQCSPIDRHNDITPNSPSGIAINQNTALIAEDSRIAWRTLLSSLSSASNTHGVAR